MVIVAASLVRSRSLELAHTDADDEYTETETSYDVLDEVWLASPNQGCCLTVVLVIVA